MFIKSKRMALNVMAVAFSVLIFTTGVFSQSDSAYIPFLVNVDATVSAWKGVDTVRIEVEANQTKTLAVYLGPTTSVTHSGARMRENALVLKSDSRGNITLRLPQQSYQTVEISLYSVNGKRVLSQKTDVSAAAVRNIALNNVASGVYILSARGINGGSFSSRLTHRGGKLNIGVEFGSVSPLIKEAYATARNDNADAWTVSVTAAGYYDSTYTFVPIRGVIALQNITLRKSDDEGVFTDTRDGKIYRIVWMPDGKAWMAENLNFQPSSSNSWCYGNNASNCNTYGRLYDWNTARSVCPTGWRLPTREDWQNLITTVGGNQGTRLKSRLPAWDGTDDFGFSALSGGYRLIDGNFDDLGSSGNWWSATETEDDADRAFNVYMRTGYLNVHGRWDDKSYGLSVRCLRD